MTLSGEIEEILTPHAFILSDHILLVVKAKGLRYAVEEATAYVTGPVRRFSLRAIETELGVDLEDGVFATFEGKPVVIAESLRVVR